MLPLTADAGFGLRLGFCCLSLRPLLSLFLPFLFCSTDSFNATPEETESKLPSASRTMVGANSPGLYAAQAYHSQKLSAKLQ